MQNIFKKFTKRAPVAQNVWETLHYTKVFQPFLNHGTHFTLVKKGIRDLQTGDISLINFSAKFPDTRLASPVIARRLDLAATTQSYLGFSEHLSTKSKGTASESMKIRKLPQTTRDTCKT